MNVVYACEVASDSTTKYKTRNRACKNKIINTRKDLSMQDRNSDLV